MTEHCATIEREKWCGIRSQGREEWNAQATGKSARLGACTEGRTPRLLRPRTATRPAVHSLEERFHEQASRWSEETAHLSSPAQAMQHPSYQAILGLALDDRNEVIRLMVRDLQENRRPWFWALSYLTQENPIERRDVGKLDRMIRAWVRWGVAKGIL